MLSNCFGWFPLYICTYITGYIVNIENLLSTFTIEICLNNEVYINMRLVKHQTLCFICKLSGICGPNKEIALQCAFKIKTYSLNLFDIYVNTSMYY